MDKLKISGTTNKDCTIKVLKNDIVLATKPVLQGNYSAVFPAASGTAVDVVAIDSNGEMDSVGSVTPVVTTDGVDMEHPIECDLINRRNSGVWELSASENNGSFYLNFINDKLTISVGNGAGNCGVTNPLLISGDFDMTVHYRRNGDSGTPDWGTAINLDSVDNTSTYIRFNQTGYTIYTTLVVNGTTVDHTENSGYDIDYDLDYRIKRLNDVVYFYSPLDTSILVRSHQWTTDRVSIKYLVEHWNNNPIRSIDVTSHYIFK